MDNILSHSPIIFSRFRPASFSSPGQAGKKFLKNESQAIIPKNSNDYQESVKELTHMSKTQDPNEISITNKNLKSHDPFADSIDFMLRNADYKWQRVDKVTKFALKKDDSCDACANHDSKKKPALKDTNVYLEPKCGHGIHQSCRSRFSRALWDFSGHSCGYQLKDCPICYSNKGHVLGYRYYAKTADGLGPSEYTKYYTCACKYFLDGNDLESLSKEKLNKL